MELSTFELLVKRIAPPPAPVSVARRVVQGYFLTLTNLESRDLTFRLRFNISRPNPAGDPDRTLFDKVDLVYDIAGLNQPIPLSGTAASTVFGGSFRVPARQTASVQLLPKQTLFGAANPNFEVRGFVSLRLPRLRGLAQSTTPVKVLLNAEVRGTFLPNGFPDGPLDDLDQINYSLALASGKALNDIESDPPFFPITLPDSIFASDNLPIPSMVETLMDADDAEKSQGLVELMSQIDPSPQNLQSLSDTLSKLNIPVRLSPDR
jgi:hypothetical protein